MNFFSSAVDRLETLAAALGAGLQAWGELKNREKCKAITTEFINSRLMRRDEVMKNLFEISSIIAGGEERPPPLADKCATII